MESGWAELPEDLLLRVLELLRWTRRDSGAVRKSCQRWRAAHDAGCKSLGLRRSVPEAMICVLCGRMPALTSLNLVGVQSFSAEGLRVVGGLTALTDLNLEATNVTNLGLRELRDLAGLTFLSLTFCSNVTDVGLQELTSHTALTTLYLYGCSTTKAGQDALKAAIPGLTIE